MPRNLTSIDNGIQNGNTRGRNARRRNPVTPIRLSFEREDSVSSTGSSVRSYNTFDTDLIRESTPITPPQTFEFGDKRSLGTSKSDHVIQTLLDTEGADPFFENGPATKPSMAVPIPIVSIEHSLAPENSSQQTEEQLADSGTDDISAGIKLMRLRSSSPSFDKPEVNDSPTSNKAKRLRNKGRSSSTSSQNEIHPAFGNADGMGLDTDVGPRTTPANTGQSSRRVAEDEVAIHTSIQRLKSAHANNLLRRDGHVRSHSTPAPPTKATATDDSDARSLDNTHPKTESPVEGQDQPENPDDSSDSGIAVSLKSNRRTSRKASTTSLPTSQVQPACAESISDSTASNSDRRTLKPSKVARKRGVSPPEIHHRSDLGNREGSKSEPGLLHSCPTENMEAVFPPKLEHYHDEVYSVNSIKTNILIKIREPAGKAGAKKKYTGDPGFIYMFTSPKYPGYIKIGKTQKNPKSRTERWSTQCKFVCNHVKDPNDKMFDNHSRVETLIQAELCNERRKFKCWECKGNPKHRLSFTSKPSESRKSMCTEEIDEEAQGLEAELSEDGPMEVEEKDGEPKESDSKGTEHGEWYEITEDRAQKVIDRWRNWIIEGRPYKMNGALTQQWQWKQKWANDSTEEVDWDKWVLSNLDETISYAIHSVDQELRELWPNLIPVVKSSGFLTLAMALMIWHVFGRGYLGFAFSMAAIFVLFYLSIRYS